MATEQWLKLLDTAKKTAIIQDGKRKVHFLLEDGKEMVEEYSLDTNVVVKRTWKSKGKLGQDIGWVVEVGDPEPNPSDNLENVGIRESSSSPVISRRITKTGLEWRIRNLPYTKDVYSVTAEDDAITVRTSNKKYFKKIDIPDLKRVGLKPEQDRLSFTHQYNTLIITYKKPPKLLEMEKKVFEMVSKLKVAKDGDVQCPTS